MLAADGFYIHNPRDAMLAPVLTRDDNGSNFLTRDPRDPLRFVDPLDP